MANDVTVNVINVNSKSASRATGSHFTKAERAEIIRIVFDEMLSRLDV